MSGYKTSCNSAATALLELVWTMIIGGTFKVLIMIGYSIFYQWCIYMESQNKFYQKIFVMAQFGLILHYYKYVFSDNEIYERICPKWSDFLLGIKKYVDLVVLQAPDAILIDLIFVRTVGIPNLLPPTLLKSVQYFCGTKKNSFLSQTQLFLIRTTAPANLLHSI